MRSDYEQAIERLKKLKGQNPDVVWTLSVSDFGAGFSFRASIIYASRCVDRVGKCALDAACAAIDAYRGEVVRLGERGEEQKPAAASSKASFKDVFTTEPAWRGVDQGIGSSISALYVRCHRCGKLYSGEVDLSIRCDNRNCDAYGELIYLGKKEIDKREEADFAAECRVNCAICPTCGHVSTGATGGDVRCLNKCCDRYFHTICSNEKDERAQIAGTRVELDPYTR